MTKAERERLKKLKGSTQMVVVKKDKAGRTRVTGGTHMKASGAYPREFGCEMAKIYADHIVALLLEGFKGLGFIRSFRV
jgi:hypothetical protein